MESKTNQVPLSPREKKIPFTTTNPLDQLKIESDNNYSKFIDFRKGKSEREQYRTMFVFGKCCENQHVGVFSN